MIMADLVIIDDDPDNLESLSELMLAAGHNVRIGHNGQVGLHLVEERLPDLALLDVEMPLLDGPGMAYRMFVRDMGLELIPVILISGIVDLKEVAAQVGTPYFLGKPYRYAQLMALVNRALHERQPPHPTRTLD